MEAPLDVAAKQREIDHSHRKSGLEKAAGEMVSGGDDGKRPRDGNNHRHAVEMEEDDDEEEDMGAHEIFEIYRKQWIVSYGKSDAAAFYKPTELLPMRHTDGPVPVFLQPTETMEIFFVKVVHLTGGLQWPLDVYGDVAVRDSLDHKRNYLFRRDRNNCQTLTSPQDSLLELTGPSRAVMLLDEPIFEIDLKVKCKGTSSSSSSPSSSSDDDKVLCLHYFGYNCIPYRGSSSRAITEEVSSESCAMELRFAHMVDSVEATITARVIHASCSFSARFTARTASLGREDDHVVVLLDSRGQEVVPVVASENDDGELVVLQRRVVVVEEQGMLILGLDAVLFGGGGPGGESTAVSQKLNCRPRTALRSLVYFDVGPVRIEMCIAWSMLS